MVWLAEDRVARFLGKSIKVDSGCWEWHGCIQANGYGRATVNRFTDYAHRHSYRMHKGEIAKGLDVCHKCDNRKCINPDHLFLGTRKDNMADAVSKDRQAKGFMLPQTKLTLEDRQRIVECAKAGEPYKIIAQKFGITKQMAGKIAIKNGVRRNGIVK